MNLGDRIQPRALGDQSEVWSLGLNPAPFYPVLYLPLKKVRSWRLGGVNPEGSFRFPLPPYNLGGLVTEVWWGHHLLILRQLVFYLEAQLDFERSDFVLK